MSSSLSISNQNPFFINGSLQILKNRAPYLENLNLEGTDRPKFDLIETCNFRSLLSFKTTRSSIFDNSHLISLSGVAPKIKILNLSGCSKIDHKALSIFSTACTNLAELDISHTEIDLDRALTSCSRLEHMQILNIAGCQKISAVGFVQMRKLPNLTHLNASGIDSLDDTIIDTFTKNHQNIKKIEIAECKKITNSALEAIQQNCKELTLLDIQGCNGVTQSAIQAMKRDNPRLNILYTNSNVN